MATLTDLTAGERSDDQASADAKANGDSSRLNCRINAHIKARAEQAAQLLGQNLTAFTEAALAEKAQSVLEQHEKLVLSERDFQRFVEVINNPPPPAPALVRAMQEHKKLRTRHPESNW